MFVWFGEIAIAPIASESSWDIIGSQVAPPLTVFHTPPFAAPAQTMFPLLGLTARHLTRPFTFRGPTLCQSSGKNGHRKGGHKGRGGQRHGGHGQPSSGQRQRGGQMSSNSSHSGSPRSGISRPPSRRRKSSIPTPPGGRSNSPHSNPPGRSPSSVFNSPPAKTSRVTASRTASSASPRRAISS